MVEERYTTEISSDGTILNRTNVARLQVFGVPGLCIADEANPALPRDIAAYTARVIEPGIAAGTIDDGSSGPYDDRKMRYDGSTVQAGGLQVRLGHSHYGEYIQARDRSPEDATALRVRGTNEFGDPHAFLARNPGVTMAVITSDGATVIGRRNVATDAPEHAGIYQAAAGHLDFRQDPATIALAADVVRELGEFGIRQGNIEDTIFTGLYSDPTKGGSDLDFTHLVRTDLPAEYFTSGTWREHATEQEHGDLVAIPTFAELQEILKGDEYNIIFSTRAALEAIRPDEMASA